MNANSLKRLLLIGPAPQNIGGISMHLRRLMALLKEEYCFDFVDEGHNKYEGVFNLRSGNILKYLYKVYRADVVHINSGIWSLRALNILVCRILLRKKTIVTIHRDPNIEPHFKLTKKLLKRCNHAILVNQEGYDAMLADGPCEYHLLPAFLPPIMEDESQLPQEMINWIKKAKSQKEALVLCSNAYRLMIHDGCDLYGLDICIEAIRQLNNNDERYYLVFVLASNPDQQERLEKYKTQIKSQGLENHILIWESPVSFVKLILESDIVLRTTNTDGDAISIREALYLGKSVVASDVVRRPEGVVLFKTRNINDLVVRIKEIAEHDASPKRLETIDYKAFYQKLYD